MWHPYFDERDLARRPAVEILAGTVHQGHDVPPFTLTTEPLPPAVPGRAEQLRAAARKRTGRTTEQRARAARLGADPTHTLVPGQSVGRSAG